MWKGLNQGLGEVRTLSERKFQKRLNCTDKQKITGGKGLEMKMGINCNPHLIRVNDSLEIPKLRLYASIF